MENHFRILAQLRVSICGYLVSAAMFAAGISLTRSIVRCTQSLAGPRNSAARVVAGELYIALTL